MTRRAPRVFVVEGYLQNGGTYMAYHLGRLCHESFGCAVFVAGSALPQAPYFDYPHAFPAIPLARLELEVGPDDLLVCNPSFSRQLFGLRLRCRKLCYVQGVTTFEVLDAFHDSYVFASRFVRDFVGRYYGLHGPVIAPFVDHERFAGQAAWDERSDEVLCLMHRPESEGLLGALEGAYRAHASSRAARFRRLGGIRQEALARAMRAHKYYLTLAPMEGFGLPALEAMASGCTVVGFDGWGGRDYFRHGVNALVACYPDLERVARHLEEARTNPELARRLAATAQADSRRFGRERFDAEWKQVLARLV